MLFQRKTKCSDAFTTLPVGTGLPDGTFDEYANFGQRQFAIPLIFCANIPRTVGDAGPYKNIAPLDNVFFY